MSMLERWAVRRVSASFLPHGVAWLVVPPAGERTFPYAGSYWREIEGFAYGFLTYEIASRALRRHLEGRTP